MENSMTITKTRNDAKLILKNMPKALQAACDKIFVAGADLGGAVVNMNEHDSAFRLALLEASNTYGKPETSEFKGFGEFACAVFGFTSAPAVTNAVKVAEHIDAPKIPKLSGWYSTGMLYELRDVPADELRKDIESGKLRPGMTQKELRAYNAAHKLASGKTELVKTYDAHILLNGQPTKQVTCTYGELLDEMRLALRQLAALSDDTIIEEDRFGSFNPHTTITPEKGKPIDAKGVVLVFGAHIIVGVYTPHKAPRTKKAESAQDVMQAAMKLTPEQRAEFIRQLSQYDPAEDDE